MEPPSTDDLRRWGAPLTKRPANLENVRNRSVLSQRAANSAALPVNCILPERAKSLEYWPFGGCRCQPKVQRVRTRDFWLPKQNSNHRPVRSEERRVGKECRS